MRALVLSVASVVAVGALAGFGGAGWWALAAAAAAGVGAITAGARHLRPGQGAGERRTRLHTRGADEAVIEVAAASTDLSLLAHRIAAATASQQVMLESIRDAVAGLSSAAADTAGSAAQSAELATTSRQRASEGSALIRRLIEDLEQSVAAALESGETIAELADRVTDVGTIASSIDNVAARTRMLALNATIEAARAGEHGRAFAVVAQEVHNLSQQAAEAAARIGRIVEGIAATSARSTSTDAANRASTERMRQGLTNAHDAGGAFDGIVRDIDMLSRNIDDVAATSADQASSAQRALASAGVVAVAARATAESAKALGTTSERIERVSDLVASSAVADAGQPQAAAALQAITGALRPVFDVPREHAGRLLALIELSRASAGQLASADLCALDSAMTGNLGRFRKEICGATVTLCPDVLADRRLWMQWWVNDGDNTRQLQVDLDPASPGFYDYTAADWYTTPAAKLATWLSDPYFDEGGADADIVTISIPTLLDGALVAIATADLNLAQLGQLCAPGLRSLGRPAALVTMSGVVVASADATLRPGKPLPEMQREWVTRATSAWTPGPDGWGLARTPTFDWALLVRDQR